MSIDSVPITINNVSLSRSKNVTRRNDFIIGIYVAIRHPDDDREYAFAQTTLRCYAQLHGYRLQFDYIEINPIAEQKCAQNVVSIDEIWCISTIYSTIKFRNSVRLTLRQWRLNHCADGAAAPGPQGQVGRRQINVRGE